MHSSNLDGGLLCAANDEADDMWEAVGQLWTWMTKDTLGQWKRSCTWERGPFAAQLTLDFAMSSTLASFAESACRSRMTVNQLCRLCVTLTKRLQPRFLNVLLHLGRDCLLH
jgi:hypothetical protein